jgi:hypothetical protein
MTEEGDLRDLTKRAIAVRSKDREFHGLEREFLYHQTKMLADYEESRDLKHPRDLGNAREEILRKFLRDSGYLPNRYAVSHRSVRVVSTTGHISNEIDVAFYDPTESLTLMKRQDVYEVHPVEGVYGVIQVKSILTKKELRSGLKNLASFKKLDRPKRSGASLFMERSQAERGFALLFAYSTDMAWPDIIGELRTFAEDHPARVWPNVVFILDRGFFYFGEANGAGSLFNEGIEAINSPVVFGVHDREGLCLYSFQSQLLALLRHTAVYPAQLEPYFQLPLIAEGHSYTLPMGKLFEIDHCDRHGDFARKISPQALEALVSWCSKTEPINWIRAMDIAHCRPEDEENYLRQHEDICIYNPEGLPLGKILVQEDDVLLMGTPVRPMTFDLIDAAGLRIALPKYYAAKEGLFACPKCAAPPKRRIRRKLDEPT